MKRYFTIALIAAAIVASANAEVVFYESFNNLAGAGGNDGYFDNSADGTVEVGAEDLLDSSLLDNQTGWGEFTKVAICNQCIRIATKKNPGSITTPSFSLNGQDAVLTFNAAAQLGDATTLHVELLGTGNLRYESQSGSLISIELPETVEGETVLSNQQYEVSITDVADQCQVRFYTESSSESKQRAYLDEFKVVAGQSGIAEIKSDSPQASAVYTLEGVRISADDAQNGIYIINGKKVRK